MSNGTETVSSWEQLDIDISGENIEVWEGITLKWKKISPYFAVTALYANPHAARLDANGSILYYLAYYKEYDGYYCLSENEYYAFVCKALGGVDASEKCGVNGACFRLSL